MKDFIILFLLTITVAVMFLMSGFWKFNEASYITKKVLAISTPLSVKLDVELIKSLNSAYE
ncbi:hypothetical protein A3K42_01545 [candidate division WWE3 bacterium RBG_13_37_7]|uniref:Uncharacterized protein n=1 Tax=candidate division WWE3 bacterium RBG_13_37_7 TaxID=1802609 RepID=A0A1F4U1I2_UNCKA|nr:MAG: hypothetical protein A3K42_01545 [candidate division WWE3 bacterium RBG_13_37_7]